MAIFQIIRNAMLLGFGVQDKLKEFVDEVVKKGELSESQGAKLVRLMSAERALASSTVVGNSTEIYSLQKHAGSDSATMPVTPPANSLFRDVPSLSGRYSAGG